MRTSPFSPSSLLGLAAVLLALGCGNDEEGLAPSIAVPPCARVARFGNGAACSLAEPTLAACGSAARRTCGGGSLCFDAPELLVCACTADADCAGRAGYINEARQAAGKAPIAAICDQSRCKGLP
jgi:hypothetical protein